MRQKQNDLEGALVGIEQKAQIVQVVFANMLLKNKVENRHLPVFFLCAFLVATARTAVQSTLTRTPKTRSSL